MVVKPKLVHYTFLSDFSCLIIIVKSSHVLWHPVNLQVCSLNRAQFIKSAYDSKFFISHLEELSK